MAKRGWIEGLRVRMTGRAGSGPRPRPAARLRCEDLEGRQLLVASLAAIADVSVPVTLGLPVALDGGSGRPQTYTVTSSNDSIGASVIRGRFLTIGVSHQAVNATDVSFNGTMTFQLFGELTPNTVARIEELVRQGFYTSPTTGNDPNTGRPFPSKNFHRVAANFPGANDFIVQGGSVVGNGTGDVNQPGFPFNDEFVQTLAFTGTGQLAMAKSTDDSNSSQFFITTGSPRSLTFVHTIFGQIVDGRDILEQMTRVSRVDDGSGQQTRPAGAILITSTTLSESNADGVVLIDTTRASALEASTITVTATDPSDNTTARRTFRVSAAANTQNERPFIQGAVPNQVTRPGQAVRFRVPAVDLEGDMLTYVVRGGVTTTGFTDLMNATATVDANGIVTLTPNANFTGGTINVLVGVRDQTNRAGGTATLDDVSNFDTQMLTVTVTNTAPVTAVTRAVRVVDDVLIVTPRPRTDRGTNTVEIRQQDGLLRVLVNGVIDLNQPDVDEIRKIVVYGAKANDRITIAADVTIRTLLDGGHGGRNVLKAGGGSARMHGWFGRNVLEGGPARDSLVGRAGRVRFVRSGGNDTLFLGERRTKLTYRNNDPVTPTGQVFTFDGRGRLVSGLPPRRARRG